MRSEANIKHKPDPYIYSFYNVSAWYLSALSNLKPAMAKMVNSFTKAMNTKTLLPKRIIMLPDKDVLYNLPTYGYSVKQLLKREINWMLRKIERGIESRRDNLKKLQPGSVVDETCMIWVKMIPRPRSDDLELIKILKLRRKFNETLEDALTEKSSMYIMNIHSMTEQNYFTTRGRLTKSGQVQLWMEINHHLKEFDEDKRAFIPIKQKNYKQVSSSSNNSYNRYHWHNDSGNQYSNRSTERRRLPTPPKARR